MSSICVQKSTIIHAGKGLFAENDIQKGEVIACISNPTQSSELKVVQKGFPHDSGIYVMFKPPKGRKQQLFVCDANWSIPSAPPMWYYMNHAGMEANADMKLILVGETPSVCWVARHFIASGAEIFFNYDKNQRNILF